jgi:hypothetical protein
MVMGALDVGGSDYAGILSWTTPMAKENGIAIRIAAEGNQLLRYRNVSDGTFFTAAIGGLKFMFEADGEWATKDAGPWPARAMWISGKSSVGYATRGDSEIKTPYDIKPGTKMGYFTFAGPLGRTVHNALLAWGDISQDDVEWVPVGSISAAAKFLIEGKADIIFAYPATAANYEIESSPKGLGWIEMNGDEDPDGMLRYLKVFPTQDFSPAELGVPSAVGVWMSATINPYPVRADTDTELAYNMAKWLGENHDKFKDGSTMSLTMNVENVVRLAERDLVPLHDGAVQYLEEKGLWTPAHEARRQVLIADIDKYIVAYAAAMELADSQGIKVDPTNEEWLTLWKTYKQDQELTPFHYYPGLD